MRLSAFVIMVVLLPVTSHSAPAITGVSGSVTHGSSITISGTGFGTKSTATPVLWDTVGNQSSYTGLTQGQTIPTGVGYPWGGNTYPAGCAGAVKYNTNQLRGKDTANYYGNCENVTLENLHLTGATQLYASWWLRTTTDLGGDFGGTNSSKYLRLSNSSYVEDANVRTMSWTSHGGYVYDNAVCSAPSDMDWWAPALNTWTFIEVWFNQNAQQFWIKANGYYVANFNTQGITSSNLNGCGTWNFDVLWRLGWDGGGTNPPPSAEIWMGDIYVDNTPARIMVCNSNTYAASSHCELQIPTSWASTSATVTVNQGSFADNSTNYLFVVDSAQAVNPTVSESTITFGSSGGDTPSYRFKATGATLRGVQ